MVAIPIFFLIFAEGTIWSPSTFLCSWADDWLFSCLWFFFYGGFWVVNTGCVFVAIIQVVGGSNQSFLSSKRFPDISPAQGHGVLSWTGASSKGGLFSKASAWGLTLMRALEFVAGRCMAVSLGLEAVLGLNLLVGGYPLSLLHGLILPDIRVCVQLRGSILAAGGLWYQTHFSFHL